MEVEKGNNNDRESILTFSMQFLPFLWKATELLGTGVVPG